MTLAVGTHLGPYERGSALDLAERNAKAKSYENATVWRFPRRKLVIGAGGVGEVCGAQATRRDRGVAVAVEPTVPAAHPLRPRWVPHGEAA